jgi:zinc and cadmium transporter
MDSNLLFYCIVMFVATLGGGAITLVRQWSYDWLHLFLSFGAGIFLGAVFFHLIPEAMDHDAPFRSGLFLLIGYLLLFFLERILLYRGVERGTHGHGVVSLTALVGLSVHSVMDGFGLAIVMPDKELAEILFTSVLAHKIPAAFTLVSLMLLAKLSRAKIVTGLLIFAATAPVGAMILGPILDYGEVAGVPQFFGMVSGSFLYVATADLLPEVFHSRERRWVNLALMIAGVIVMSLFGVEHAHP